MQTLAILDKITCYHDVMIVESRLRDICQDSDSLFNDYPVHGRVMVSSDKLIGDAIGSMIEKVLMAAGITNYSKVADMLVDNNMAFSDCYQKPDILNSTLKEVFGNKYLTIVEKIKDELTGLDEDEKINAFLELISKP